MSTTATFGARDAESLTGSAQDLGKTARGFFCGTAGDLVVTMESGNSVTFTAIAAGTIHPIRFTGVTSFSGADGLALY
jgi:hypothetical protein